MIPIRHRIATTLVVAIAFAAGCGRSAPADSSSEKAAPAGKPPGSSATRNACELIDRAQIEAIAGRKLEMLNDIQEEDLTVCELREPGGSMALVTVTVHWTGGKELARVNQAAMSMARQMLNDDDVNIEEITGSNKVRGLADKAYYSDLMPSWVLKSDVLIEVISPLFAHEQTKAVFVSVSKSALSRL